MFRVMMSDNVKARELQSSGRYVRVTPEKDEIPLNSQEYFYDEAYRRLAEKAVRQERMKAVRARKQGRKSTVKKRKTNKK